MQVNKRGGEGERKRGGEREKGGEEREQRGKWREARRRGEEKKREREERSSAPDPPKVKAPQGPIAGIWWKAGLPADALSAVRTA